MLGEAFYSHLGRLPKFHILAIFGPKQPQMGYMQKFLPSFWGLGSSACCLHILDTARVCFLGIFKEFSPTHTPVHAPLTFIANRDPKSTEIRPKIAFLQKFRLRNFGRGVSGAPPKFFLNYKYKLFSPKKFSWSSDF